ncbi:type ISP restriction/modification enzyme [Peribacillus sp. AS_2]|uniref:type ISP restriction/modification enzyme n=1 Tax=Peribacillus sp. AS_2 TaxID=2996755 RepID=UPI0022A7A8A3|nr:type ISP restriction/modification enzyme [Peribacillus sp. AS_2]MCZ0870917.1 N-6 DNA methylase [Peribacillus sp. AS_2]
MLNKDFVREYLMKLKNTYVQGKESGSATPEMTYRPNISNFFDQIINRLGKLNDIGYIHEPSSTGKGRPDYKFHNINDYSVYGYVEVKYISNAELDPLEFEEQINRYSELETKLILTDGIEFVFFHNAQTIDDFSVAPRICLVNSKANFLNGEEFDIPEQVVDDLYKYFNEFFSSATARDLNNDQFIDLLARRANFIKDDVRNLLLKKYHDYSSEVLAVNLQQIYKVFKENLDETLDEESFASLVGQTLIFSLLLAYIEKSKGEEDVSVKSLQEYLLNDMVKEYRPLAAMTTLVFSSPLSYIATGWNDTATLLSKIKIDLPELLNDFHKIYDSFHGKYDQEERLDFGAYATPGYLADYAVKLSNKVAQKHFKKSIYSEGAKLIDPSCGTGSFLEALYKNSKLEKEAKGFKISGIEILPAPYVLSQMRINQLVDGIKDSTTPKVYLGNSLSDDILKEELIPYEKEMGSSAQLLREEFNELTKASSSPLVVIIGNPPSSDSGFNMGENFTEIESALESFRPPIESRRGRQNIQKQLQNDFVKFIMWACIKIDKLNGGIISFIVPSSALVDKSYVYMREYLQANFSEIYVLEFDADLRKTGMSEKNIFATRQGRALLTLVKKPSDGKLNSENDVGKIFYKALLGKNGSEKKEWLDNDQNLLDYIESHTYGWLKAFKPIQAEEDLVSKYSLSFWELDKIFKNHVSGVKTGCTALVVHSNKDTLMSLLEDFSTEAVSDEEINKRYFENQAKVGSYRSGWKRAYTAKEIQENLNSRNIVDYDFRPFLKRFVFYSPKVMKTASKDGGRARPELEVLFLNSDYQKKALAVAKSPSLVSKNLDQFAYIVENLPDNDLASRGNSYIFPLYFPDKKTKSIGKNVDESLIKILNEKFYENSSEYDTIAGDLIDYMYTVLSSKVFRVTYEQIIYFGLVEGMLRIPLTSNKELYFRGIEIGKKLRKLQSYEIEGYEGLPEVIYEGERSLKLKNVTFQVDSQTIILNDFDKKKKGYFKEVPTNVFNYVIKGYDVLKTWFKYQQLGYNHKTFDSDSIDQATSFIIALSTYIKEIDEANTLIKEVLEGDVLIPNK